MASGGLFANGDSNKFAQVGEALRTWACAEVRNDARVVASYLGVDERAIARSGTAAPATVQGS